MGSSRGMRAAIALSAWAFLAWVLLSWTLTLEQLLFGAGISVLVGVALAPLGEVTAPWALRPRVVLAAARITVTAAGRIVASNLRLSRRIWLPSRPLESGMVVVPTDARSAAALTTVALVTSVTVDNQFVDLDRAAGRLQYHAIAIPSRDPQEARAAINGPVERLLPADGSPI
ncbi:MAG: rane bound protein complex subunit MbxA [Actinomycetia bacterium]|jgi:multicomponent Na+:H+ antiporter subunit E|nr:rane bound protein complex subunit MbxA [Actinomycetes bacterium]